MHLIANSVKRRHAKHGLHVAMRRQGRPVALSLEMFERDVQGIMDEYLAGMIAERDLQRVRRTL